MKYFQRYMLAGVREQQYANHDFKLLSMIVWQDLLWKYLILVKYAEDPD